MVSGGSNERRKWAQAEEVITGRGRRRYICRAEVVFLVRRRRRRPARRKVVVLEWREAGAQGMGELGAVDRGSGRAGDGGSGRAGVEGSGHVGDKGRGCAWDEGSDVGREQRAAEVGTGGGSEYQAAGGGERRRLRARDEEATFVVARGMRHLSGGGSIPCRAWAETEEAGEEGGGRGGVEGRRLSGGSNKRRKWARAEEVSIGPRTREVGRWQRGKWLRRRGAGELGAPTTGGSGRLGEEMGRRRGGSRRR